MKYCEFPFKYLYLDHYNGDVYLCPWNRPGQDCIGNLFKQDFEEIWNSKKANEIRDSFRDGSFSQKFCRKVACPHLQNNDLIDIDYNETDSRWKEEKLPKCINLAFDFVCNQSCPTCRSSVFVPDKNYIDKCERIVAIMQPIIDQAELLTASGHGDPFASPFMMNVLQNLRPKNKSMRIWLETNGVLFDEEHWEKIKHLAECNLEIIITTNSYREEIYNLVSRGGNLEKLKQNEIFIKKLRDEGKIKRITNAIVVQDRTYLDIPDFIEKSLDVYGFDQVVMRPVYNWGNLSEEEYWFKDVLNPLHPYHEEYKRIIALPIVKNNPRVYNFGGETMHEPKPMPGEGSTETQKAKAYMRLFKKWIAHEDVGATVCRALEAKGRKNIMIYGAADVGKALERQLAGRGVSVLGFIDQFACDCEANGIPLYRLGCAEIQSADAIIVTPVHSFCEIERDILETGYKGCVLSVEDMLTEDA